MRNRDKKLEDFGLTMQTSKEFYKRCLTLTPEQVDRLQDVARGCCLSDVVAGFVVQSLTTGTSYERLYKKYYVPAGKSDFYAYRKKVISEYFLKPGETNGERQISKVADG